MVTPVPAILLGWRAICLQLLSGSIGGASGHVDAAVLHSEPARLRLLGELPAAEPAVRGHNGFRPAAKYRATGRDDSHPTSGPRGRHILGWGSPTRGDCVLGNPGAASPADGYAAAASGGPAVRDPAPASAAAFDVPERFWAAARPAGYQASLAAAASAAPRSTTAIIWPWLLRFQLPRKA